MVLGMKTKVRNGTSVQLTYLIHIQEIKPWPPSHSLRSLRSVQIQWEHGEKRTGSTNSVIPSLGSGANDGKIEFNESFRLPVTLMRNMSVKAGDADLFQKNCLEFSMYEPRRDKTFKGQLLGSATMDLAEYGVIKQSISINVPVKCQRNYKNTAQPLLYVKIQPAGKSCNNVSSKSAQSKEASLDRNGGESVLALMKEEYAEEAESNTYSDDDVSSSSSMAISSDSSGGLLPKHDQESNSVRDKGKGDETKSFSSDTGIKDCDVTSIVASREEIVANSSRSSSMDLSYDLEGPDNGRASSISPKSCSISIHKADVHCGHSSLSSFTNGQRDEESNGSISSERNQSIANCANVVDSDLDGRFAVVDGGSLDEIGKTSDVETNDGRNIPENHEMRHQYVGSGAINQVSRVSTDSQGSQAIDSSSFSMENLGAKEFTPSERLRHARSVRSTSGTVINPLIDDVKGSGILGDSKNDLIRNNERKESKASARDTRTTLLEAKAQQMERKIQMLEGELREVAAVEVALYSIVAEHGSSICKVHAPARRLSRFYLHADQEHSLLRRASAARSAISGLVLVSKACGNDVPRLTYWLSNSVALRAIISKTMADKELSTSPPAHSLPTMKQNDKTPAPALKWESSPIKNKSDCNRTSDWEDPQTFISALEKVEAWIFSRAVESIWWQTLTPRMQSPGASRDNSKENNHNQLDLWKKAFREACERLCPVRAGGHECGCLSMLPRLIMEQCVSRLDVAMFNAILRESADDIPTDPVSDPISDTKVLPIPPGKSSFGDGAQLKTVIGNWSRWLTDLFGMDDDSAKDKNDSHSDDDDDDDDDDDRQDSSFKSFHLLNALSDLMMLPKDMLLSKSIRQEVCPTFGVSLIKRVLNTFVPDEFCPDPIPGVVFEALDSEDQLEDGCDSVASYPYNAAPPLYIPPSPNAVAAITGECGTQNKLQRTGSSLLRKSYTSDDELDELNSPMALIFTDEARSRNSETHQNALRFDLLRDIWLNSE